MRTKKRIFFRLIKTLLFLIGVGLLVYSLISFLRSEFWRIKQIDCHLNGRDCSAELRGQLMRLFQGENFFFLSPSAAAEKVVNSPLKISKVKVEKRFPNSLAFQLEARQVRVAITRENKTQKEFYLVDQDGFFLEKGDDSVNLPLVLVDDFQEVKLGHQFRESILRTAIRTLVNLQLRLLKPRLARINSAKEIELELENSTHVLISSQKELDLQLDSLQLIFSRTKIEGKLPRRIDLRFDKPVISYE